MSVQTVTRETLHLRLQRNPFENEVRPLIREMLSSRLFPENEILEWEEVFFSDDIPMPYDHQLIFLLTKWILPSGDEQFEEKVRSILRLRMPDERIDTLIEEHQQATIQKVIEEKKAARILAVAQEGLQQRADMAEQLNQRLASQYETGTREIFGLVNGIQSTSAIRTEQLVSLNNRISRSREEFMSRSNETTKLLERRKELQNERQSILKDAMIRLRQ